MEETNLKVRLVGAIVLVSLAVIFIPMVLDGREVAGTTVGESNIPPKPENGFISKVIPLTPTLDVKPVEEKKLEIKKGLSAQVTPKVEQQPKIQAVPKTTVPVTVAKLDTKKTTKPRAGLSAWAVQVGNFSSKKNAYALQDKLRKKGFSAFVDTLYKSDIPSFRVRVGPELKRELAEKLRKKLAGFHEGRTFIVKHPS